MNEKICPICKKENDCSKDKNNCWCFDVTFSKELLSMIPPDMLNKSCICKECYEKYNNTEKHEN